MNSIFNKKAKEESTTYDTVSSLSHTKWNYKYQYIMTMEVHMQQKDLSLRLEQIKL